jgi:hypothetical protein
MSRIFERDRGTHENRDLAGSTVDELLASGDVEAARAEFERLCLEGLAGEPVSMTPEAWKQFCDELQRKAKLAS